MNRKKNRTISIVLSVIMLLSTIPLTGSMAASEPRYDRAGMEFMDDTAEGKALYEQHNASLPRLPGGGAPPQFKTVQGTKLYINYRLWTDQGVLCYGNYMKVPKNDFKSSTQKPGKPVVKNDGYYLKDGKRGEYRYHGYDVNGNHLTNLNFEPDSIVTKFNERAWIINPWTDLPVNKRPQQRSVYNDASTGLRNYADPSVQPGVRNWINKSLQQYGGVPLIGNITDPEVFRYLYVESAPSLLGIGQGRMWHEYRDGSIWYQTIAVPQLTAKENPPVTAAIELLTKLPESVTDVGTDMDGREITLRFKVSGVLRDSEVYNDPVKMTVYYTRYDIKDWNITFTGPEQPAQIEASAIGVANKGSGEFEYKTTYGFLKKHSSTAGGKTTWNLRFTATAKPNYKDGKQGLTGNAAYNLGIGVIELPLPPPIVVLGFSPDNRILETAFDGVPFTAYEYTDMSRVEERKVFVDGEEVSGDLFFSGSYIFPGEVDENGRFSYVDCEYRVKDIPGDAGLVVTRDVVYIYPTKPIANFKISSNTWKQNRLIKAQNTCNAGNIQLVVDTFPIVQYEWSFKGGAAQLRKGTDTDFLKEFMYKEPGIYSLTLRCKNKLGRWSDKYSVQFQVLEDTAPAVGVNLSESVYTRKDTVSAWYYFVGSTDGDVIKSSSIELWYDSDNNGTVNLKAKTWSNQGEFPKYAPVALGYYKYIITAQEDILSDTLPQFITEADKKTARYEVEFWVDNYRPLADLYVNIPVQRPNIDIFLMIDKNIDAAKKECILNNRVNMSNWLLGKNIIPNVSIWDLRTYTYSQPANTSKNNGGSIPPKTVTYTNNGYTGTLERTRYSNNDYSVDEGSYQTREESKSVSESATNTNSGTCEWTGTCWKLISKDETQLPSTRSYSDSQGYSGTLYKGSGVRTGEYDNPPSNPRAGDTYTYYSYWSVLYTGTVYKTVQVWVPDIVWYDDYTGYYSGTIYKDVKQPYTDTFSPTSSKYVVYVSDTNISDLADLNTVMKYAKTAKLILAGNDSIKSQRAHDLYLNTAAKTIDAVLDEILTSITENSPAVEKYYVLQNESFVMNVGQLDLESDAIVETGMQYVHEPGYFDNPTGSEPGAVPEHNENTGWTAEIKSSFANTGKYTVYRRVKDSPTTDARFAGYSYYSGIASLEIYTHRKPLAMAVLDWDYDQSEKVYRTTWVDHSYDPDHQYSRADKGIVERRIMYRQPGNEWIYNIPDRLPPGAYELYYYVRDPEGAWSAPLFLNFVLDEAPSMQLGAELRTLDSKFSLTGVPASEKLEAYNLWTRFPRDVRLQMALYSGAARVSSLRTVILGSTTGTKVNNDIGWNNVVYQIPETLPDRVYDFKITAVGSDGSQAEKSFEVRVSTPLDLEPDMPDEVSGGASADVSAKTSVYADVVNVTLFHATAYAKTYSLTASGAAGESCEWKNRITIPGSVPDGDYIARYTAIAANGSTQTKDLPFRLANLAVTGVDIGGYWNHWRGQTDMLGEQMTNEPHRFLSLECVKIDIQTTGDPDRVTVRFSPELEAMSYTDPNGHSYEYSRDFFGYNVLFPSDSTFSVTGNHAYWEYYLPLAPASKGWDNTRLRPRYRMVVTAYKGSNTAEYIIDDIDITGNIYDLTYIQPRK